MTEFTINGHTVTAVNCCPIQYREPDEDDMKRCWSRDRFIKHIIRFWDRERIVGYLEYLPGRERELFRDALNRERRNG